MFDKYFEAVLADCEESKRIHYQVRYQVYCIEAGYEDHRAFDDCEEKDEWDESSSHFLVRSKLTGEWIAAMRLILPNPKNRQPVFQLCDIDTTVIGKAHDSMAGAEISRLCIINSFRRRLPYGGQKNNQASLNHQEDNVHSQLRKRCKEPLILLGFVRAAAQYCRENSIPYWYFLTTSSMARILKRMNVHITKAGKSCIYNGERHPFVIGVEDAVEQMRSGSGAFDKMMENRVGYLHYSQLYSNTHQNLPNSQNLGNAAA